MTIDMEQFRVTYIEESLEGLDSMETYLLDLQPGSEDQDAINTIFRAAHSIKGGGATFGLEVISEFTHVVETLLDEIRNGDREITQEAIDLFLESVDCIRDMLATAKEGEELTVSDKTESVKQSLDTLLAGDSKTETRVEDVLPKVAGVAAEIVTGWHIDFRPRTDMLSTGNDVVRMFRELADMGDLSVTASFDDLPTLADIVPEECYLSWIITLKGNIEKEKIDDVFVWVEDECDLILTAITEHNDTGAVSNAGVNTLSAETIATQNTKPQAVKAAVDKRSGTERRASRAGAETSSIRVDIDKIDALINMVGELVITQSMLSQFGEEFDITRLEKLKDGLGQLERNTRELQESVMRIRMIPISFAFNRFPRMIHDMCSKLGKNVQLKLSGESTELDKTVMEKIGDPLVHLVRNSMDHGIETPEGRRNAGKPEQGTVHLNAYHQGGNIVIEITDDGAGLNRDKIIAKAVQRGLVEPGVELPDSRIYDLVFHPGFSTADKVTDVSGRGVGMDVVKKNIQALGGMVEVRSEVGVGSTFTIRLPLTLAILDGQLIRVKDQTYIAPLVSIIESLQIESRYVNAVAGKAEVYKLREDYIPIVRLGELFELDKEPKSLEKGLLVVVEGDNQKVGLLVDDLLAQQQVVIKSLETNYKKVEGLSGATILGDGTVALILDVSGIIRVSQEGPAKLRQSTVLKNNVVAA